MLVSGVAQVGKAAASAEDVVEVRSENGNALECCRGSVQRRHFSGSISGNYLEAREKSVVVKRAARRINSVLDKHSPKDINGSLVLLCCHMLSDVRVSSPNREDRVVMSLGVHSAAAGTIASSMTRRATSK